MAQYDKHAMHESRVANIFRRGVERTTAIQVTQCIRLYWNTRIDRCLEQVRMEALHFALRRCHSS